MKKVFFFVAATMLMASCSFMKNSASSSANSTANNVVKTAATAATATASGMQAGQGAGSALYGLYNQFKADGKKFNYQNTQNITNTVSLLANCAGLATNYNNTEYLKEFGKGLISGSFGLVNQQNVGSVTNSLVEMVKNSETAQKTSSAAATASNYAGTTAQYASAISSLLSSLGGK